MGKETGEERVKDTFPPAPRAFPVPGQREGLVTAAVRRSVLQAEEQQWHLQGSQMNLAGEAERKGWESTAFRTHSAVEISADKLAFSLPSFSLSAHDPPLRAGANVRLYLGNTVRG